MIEKNGMLTPESKGDFNTTKKAEYEDEDGFYFASEEEKHLLKNPKNIKADLEKEED